MKFFVSVALALLSLAAQAGIVMERIQCGASAPVENRMVTADEVFQCNTAKGIQPVTYRELMREGWRLGGADGYSAGFYRRTIVVSSN